MITLWSSNFLTFQCPTRGKSETEGSIPRRLKSKTEGTRNTISCVFTITDKAKVGRGSYQEIDDFGVKDSLKFYCCLLCIDEARTKDKNYT
jgi:hypothetical protein